MDIMIDLETLGITPDAPIIAIGLIAFDREKGCVGNGGNVKIDFESACERRTPSASTIKWWLGQSEGARKSVVAGKMKMHEALSKVATYIKHHGDDVKVWGNGATFDISMLEDAMRMYGVEVPWKFWNVRDCRTIEDISSIDKRSIPREGVHHDALDDAKHQVKYICAMLKELKS